MGGEGGICTHSALRSDQARCRPRVIRAVFTVGRSLLIYTDRRDFKSACLKGMGDIAGFAQRPLGADERKPIVDGTIIIDQR